MERRRPPRLVSGDGKLLPLVRGGSTKQVRRWGARAQVLLPHLCRGRCCAGLQPWCLTQGPDLVYLQSRIEEIGQALLRNTLLAAPDGLKRVQQGGITGGRAGGWAGWERWSWVWLPCD